MYVLLPSNQNYPNRIRFPNRYIPIRDAVFLWKEVFHVLPIEIPYHEYNYIKPYQQELFLHDLGDSY